MVAVLVLVTALLLGAGAMSLRQMSLENSAIRNFVGSTATINFQVSTDPQQTVPKVIGMNMAPARFSFLATALEVRHDGEKFRLRVPIRVIASTRKVLGLLPGQMIQAQGNVVASQETRVAVLFIVRDAIKIVTPASKWARSLGSIRTNLRALSSQDDAGALIPGMVLGDTSLQSLQFKTAMRRSGLTHLVAVSGANFAIISFFVLWCMQWIFRSLRMRLFVTALALICIIALVRPSPSVLRAAAMASVVLFARGTGRRSDPLPALGFAMAAVVIGDPWQARDPGFALSVMATAGLLLLAPRLTRWMSKYIPSAIAAALSPPMAAVIMCAPILIALSGYLSLMTVMANLLAAPMVAPITIIGFIAAIFSPFIPHVSSLLLHLIHFPALWIAGVAHWAAGFPVVQFGKGSAGFISGILVLLIGFVAFLFIKKGKWFFIVVVVVLVLTFSWFSRWPGGAWSVANCDVGQGDSMVINLGGHRGIVIDTGPDPQLEDRCLHQLGIDVIPLLVLTHFHADHVEGLSGLLSHRKVGQVWTSNDPQPILENVRVRKLLQGIPTTIVLRGTSAQIESSRGPIYLKVLWPRDASTSFAGIAEDGSTINNSSVALNVQTRDFSLFAGGDIEPASQAEILPLPKFDLYKVSHHGSAHQDNVLMREISPLISFISVGLGNTYGHPSIHTISYLVRLGSKVYRTDLDGGIAILARNHVFSVRTSGGAWWKKVRLT